ncbi:carboxylesterase family protein [uncultured Megasphaera sp.]|uniref:carboxylesterase family protein n=1 Tax=uncultured Megasphaera sp. TaxID=165188 RepID=UPI00266C271E|nr:carboxylesterase family protein [uncultured Megasphaera sp.]
MEIRKKVLLSLMAAVLSASAVLAAAPDPQAEITAQAPQPPVQVRRSKAIIPAYQQQPLQNTQYGFVKGVKDDQTLIWKGVPYGTAQRWKAPQNPSPWEGIKDATKAGPTAIQQTAKGYTGVEDSLNLDIYRPDTAEINLPVLFFIHGGNNQTGDSEQVNLKQFAEKANVVAISAKFRLGALGFNPLPALKHGTAEENSGNYTLLDIMQGLDWTKDNIRSFGGNPHNITVSGFSSGGRDVMALLISPAAKGKFQKAISFSGGMTTSDTADAQKIFAKHLAPYVVADGIKATEAEAEAWLLQDTSDVADYLHQLSADKLAGSFGHAFIRMNAFPHLYTDGVVLDKDGFQTTTYNQVPLLMLSGTNEFTLFARSDPYFKKAVDDETVLTDARKKQEFLFARNYGSQMYELFNVEASAAQMSSHYGSTPIYTMIIAYGENPDIVGEKAALLSGSVHGIWIPFVTGYATATATGYPAGSFDNAGALALTDAVQQYIGNFMRRGNPNGKGLAPWKQWSPVADGPTQLVVNADTEKAWYTQTYGHTTYDPILKEMDQDTSIDSTAKENIIHHVLNGRWFSQALDAHFNNK